MIKNSPLKYIICKANFNTLYKNMHVHVHLINYIKEFKNTCN